MSDSSYVILREDNPIWVGQSDIESPKCKDNTIWVGQNDIERPKNVNSQSTNQSLSKVNVALGLVVCLTVLIGGIFMMTGPQADVTRADLDWRRNQTHLILDTR